VAGNPTARRRLPKVAAAVLTVGGLITVARVAGALFAS
jgi:hypothetical protein